MPTAADPRHLQVMHQAHGLTEGRVCRECAHCIHERVSHHRLGSSPKRVCRKAAPHVTGHGKVSYRYWRVTWPACGLFQESEA